MVALADPGAPLCRAGEAFGGLEDFGLLGPLLDHHHAHHTVRGSAHFGVLVVHAVHQLGQEGRGTGCTHRCWGMVAQCAFSTLHQTSRAQDSWHLPIGL